jgi:hypothetical protein
MKLTDRETADETFLERVAICMEDGKQSEDIAILTARIEKRARETKTIKPIQKSIRWNK